MIVFGISAETWSSCAVPRSGIGNNRVSRIRYCRTGKLQSRGFEDFLILLRQMMKVLDTSFNYWKFWITPSNLKGMLVFIKRACGYNIGILANVDT